MAEAKGDELPGYTPRPAAPTGAAVYRSEHKYSLENKGRPWLFIFIKSRSPNANSGPFFMQGDTVAGRVELDIDKAESLKSISVGILAGATAVGQEEVVFLKVDQDLWPAATDKSGKLAKGKYSWPFSFKLPAKVSPLTGEEKGLEFDAPPSFTERASPAYIDYRTVVTVKRGAFKMNQTLTTSFAYIQLTQPAPPSALRQLAYKEGGDLIGPDGDPQGWKVLQPVKFKGKLFDTKEVEVKCTLAIATPLAFTVGSPIPLELTLTSDDEQALDTLANSKAINLHLVRSIALGSDAMEEKAERRSNTFFPSGAGQGYFWPSTEGAKEAGKRTMRGELEVKKGMKAGFHFPRFTVRYSLELLPFSITGFAPLGTGPLLSEPVKIMTKSVPGVTPKSYAPPGYEKPEGSDYNSAVGFLENGNQRFYHHGGFA
ncbi:hypothetical protein K438DRAFT_1816872 [Mycena galopus ATCC 62051]|nr:hypothetical protein K438DRAFT_1816872 [Mycena galopus ATCC 62051]